MYREKEDKKSQEMKKWIHVCQMAKGHKRNEVTRPVIFLNLLSLSTSEQKL